MLRNALRSSLNAKTRKTDKLRDNYHSPPNNEYVPLANLKEKFIPFQKPNHESNR